MTEQRKTPARWRKPKMPWGLNNIAQFIWRRERADDRELWRGDERLAVAYPDGRWAVHIGDGCRGQETDQQAAMERARGVVRKIESEAG